MLANIPERVKPHVHSLYPGRHQSFHPHQRPVVPAGDTIPNTFITRKSQYSTNIDDAASNAKLFNSKIVLETSSPLSWCGIKLLMGQTRLRALAALAPRSYFPTGGAVNN